MRGEAASPARRGCRGGEGPWSTEARGGNPRAAIRVAERFDWSTWEIRSAGRHDIHLLLSL